MKRELDLVAAAQTELLLEQTEVKTSDRLVVQQKLHYSNPTGWWWAPEPQWAASTVKEHQTSTHVCDMDNVVKQR